MSPNFYNSIQDTPTIVDFYASWCEPCKLMRPKVEEIEKQYEGKVKVLYIDVDEDTRLAQELGVMLLPSILFFKNGELVDGLQGTVDKEEIEKKIKRIIN